MGKDKPMQYEHIKHPWGAVYDKNSEILILGSLPSPKSRENNFFYGHPKNRFWELISIIFDEPVPVSIEEKITLLARNRIALWDVVEECDIVGASDSSIKNVVPTSIADIISSSKIHKIICNGTKAYDLYCKYQFFETGIDAIKLPSTSPANAAWSLGRLEAVWREELILQKSKT